MAKAGTVPFTIPEIITRPLQKSSESYTNIVRPKVPNLEGSVFSKPPRLQGPSRASIANFDADTEAVDYVKGAIEKYGGQAAHYVTNAVGSVEEKLLKEDMIYPSDVILFNGFLKGAIGLDIPTSDETIKYLGIGGPPSKELAFKISAGVGALASMYGISAAVGATGAIPSIMADLYKFPKIARFVEPALSWGAASGGVDVVHEGVRQIQGGKLDFERFGKVLLHGAALGATGGLTQGFSNGLARTVGGTAFGYLSTKLQGGGNTAAVVNGGVMGLFSVLSSKQATRAQQEGVYGYTLKNIEKTAAEYGAKNGLTAEESLSRGRAAQSQFAKIIQENGGVENIKVQNLEKVMGEVRNRVINLIEQKPSADLAKPAEIAQEPPLGVPPVQEPPKAAPAAPPAPAEVISREAYGLQPEGEKTLYRAMSADEYSNWQKTGVIPSGPAARATERKDIADFYATQRGEGSQVVEFKANVDDIQPAGNEPGSFRILKDIQTHTPLEVITPTESPKQTFTPEELAKMKGEAFDHALEVAAAKSAPLEVIPGEPPAGPAQVPAPERPPKQVTPPEAKPEFKIGKDRYVMESPGTVRTYESANPAGMPTAMVKTVNGKRDWYYYASKNVVPPGELRTNLDKIYPIEQAVPPVPAEPPKKAEPLKPAEIAQEPPLGVQPAAPVHQPVIKTEEPISKADSKKYHVLQIKDASLPDIKAQVVSKLKYLSAQFPGAGESALGEEKIFGYLKKGMEEQYPKGFAGALKTAWKAIVVADKPIKIHIPDDGTFLIEPTKYGVEQAIRIFSKAPPSVFTPITGKSGEAKAGHSEIPKAPGQVAPPGKPESSLGRGKMIGEVAPKEKVAVAASKSVPGVEASQGGGTIDTFEKVSEQAPSDMKLSEEVRNIFDKYDTRVGERYVSGDAGRFYKETENVRLRALNDVSTASHELTHRLDQKNRIMEQVYTPIGATEDGKPKYDPALFQFRKEMTGVYTKYYPGGKKNHKLKKRMVEGYATFIQKFIEQPTRIREEFPTLTKEILQTGGRFQNDEVNAMAKDYHELIGKYQALDPLSKIGARVTQVFKQNDLEGGFLNLWDKVVTQIVDEIHPLVKLAREGGVERTAADPSLWARQYNNTSAIILNNMRGDKGFWMPKANGDFVKESENNLGDMVEMMKEQSASDSFNHWLVARREHFQYQKLDRLEVEARRAVQELRDMNVHPMGPTAEQKKTIEALKGKIEEYQRLKGILKNDGFDREVVKQAYEEHKEIFTELEKVHDVFPKAMLDLFREAGLITADQHTGYSGEKGYASFKRDVLDQILGTGETPLPPSRTGPSRISALLGRKGSQLDIIAPVASLFRDHAEGVRKALKQIIVNKVWEISKNFPELFQEIDLIRQYDPKTKITKYPQDRDPSLLIARDSAGKRHPLLAAREIKIVMDDILDFHNIHVLERLMRRTASIFTKGTTGAYPLFAPANFVVDQITAAAMTRNHFVPLYDPISKMVKALKDHGSDEAQYLQTYLAAGGERQTFARWQDLPPDELFNKIAGEKGALEKTVELIDLGFDAISWASSKSEVMTRAAEYINSRKAGNPHIVALEDAGRVSVPFHHVGMLGGGTFGKTFVKSVPFFNPSIQALAQYARSVKNKSTRNRSLFVTLAVIASSIGAMAYLMAKATDKQKELYNDLEPDELANYIWLPSPNGERLLKIRVPEQMNMISTLVNMELANIKMGANYEGKDFLAAATAFLPDQFNVTDPIRQFFSMIPQLVKPGLMVMTGKKDWPRLREMESMGIKSKEPGQRFNENTAAYAKWLGGKLGISPIKIDYLIEGYLGRITRLAPGTKPLTNPFVRDYFFTAGRNLQDYYETREKVTQRLNTHKDKPGSVPDAELDRLFEIKSIVTGTEQLLKYLREFEKHAKEDKMPAAEMEAGAEELRRAILDNIDSIRQVKKGASK